jgi:hypothetical protein
VSDQYDHSGMINGSMPQWVYPTNMINGSVSGQYDHSGMINGSMPQWVYPISMIKGSVSDQYDHSGMINGSMPQWVYPTNMINGSVSGQYDHSGMINGSVPQWVWSHKYGERKRDTVSSYRNEQKRATVKELAWSYRYAKYKRVTVSMIILIRYMLPNSTSYQASNVAHFIKSVSTVSWPQHLLIWDTQTWQTFLTSNHKTRLANFLLTKSQLSSVPVPNHWRPL